MRNYISLIIIFLLPACYSGTDVPLKGLDENFEKCAKETYQLLQTKSLSYKVFELALWGYWRIAKENRLDNTNVLTIIDFKKSSKMKRLFVIDLVQKKIVFEELVAHGVNTGLEYAQHFSNENDSKKSSLGFYVTGRIYQGKHGSSLKLFGLEDGINNNAYKRAIVIHGADYVSKQFIEKNGRLGRSFGCFSLSGQVNESIINIIKEGSCLFAYYPDEEYLKSSKYLQITVK